MASCVNTVIAFSLRSKQYYVRRTEGIVAHDFNRGRSSRLEILQIL